MRISEEDRNYILHVKEVVDKGYFVDSRQLVDAYNRVFDGERPRQNYTTCMGCLRKCFWAMYNGLMNAEAVLQPERPKTAGGHKYRIDDKGRLWPADNA